MIQRIQSFYLGLAAVLLGLEYMFSSAFPQVHSVEYGWFLPLVLGLFTLAAIGGLGAIFLFNNRKRQRGIVVILQYLTLLGLLSLIVAHAAEGTLPSVSMADEAFSTWAALISPVLAYLMFLLAKRNIDKDIALVRSMDRLR